MAFDVQSARSAGYSDDEIATHLGEQSNFDVPAARKSGYGTNEIIDHLSGSETPAAQRDLVEGVKPSTAGAGRGITQPAMGLADSRASTAPAPASTVPVQRTRDYGAIDMAGDAQGFGSSAFESAMTPTSTSVDQRRTRAPGRVTDADIPGLTPWSTLQDAASGALQIGPTVVQGVGELARLATGDRLGKGLSDFADRGNKSIQEVVGSDRGAMQRKRFEQDMADKAMNPADVIIGNPGALADQVLPTVGSMAIPIGVSGVAGKLATSSKAAQLARVIDEATVLNRANKVREAAAIGATVAQNSASTYSEIRDKGGEQDASYLGAAISAPASYIAGRLTGGGAEAQAAKLLSGSATGAIKAIPKAMLKEGAQEIGEEVGGYVGETVGTGQEFDVNAAGKRLAVAGTLGAVMGGGVEVAGAAGEMRQQRIKTLIEAGDTATADLMQKKHDRLTAIESVDGELQRMPSTPEFAQSYRDMRGTGMKPAESAARSAINVTYRGLASSAGMSDSAIKVALDKANSLPLDEAPAVLHKFTAALERKGLVQPGTENMSAQLEAARDDAIEAAMGSYQPSDIRNAMSDVLALENSAETGYTPSVNGVYPISGEGGSGEGGSVVNKGLTATKKIAASKTPGNETGYTPNLPQTYPGTWTPSLQIDQAAHEAATSPLNDTPQPTDAQKKAGNYKVGRVNLHGLNISIENPQGSERSGTSPDGTKWSNTLAAHYGYIRGTEGNDGDHVDTFIGPNPDSQKVFVVDQVNKDGSFDEHKVMLGADSIEQADTLYHANYHAGWTGRGAITEMPMAEFKDWVRDGIKTKPLGIAESSNSNQPLALTDQAKPAIETVATPAPVTQPAQLGTAGEGAGGSQPTQVAPKPEPKPFTDLPSLSADQQQQLDDKIASDSEREFQQGTKRSIQERLGLIKPSEADQKKTPFKSFLREYGIAPTHTSDIAGKNWFKANNALPATFRANGLSLDDLTERAIERGFMQEGDRGDTNKLISMIQGEIAGEAQVSSEFADDQASASAEQAQRREIEAVADGMGLPYTPDTSTDQLASMVNRINTRLEKEVDVSWNGRGSLKSERVLAKAKETVARIERKRAQYRRELAQFAEATIAEQDALLELLQDADGNPIIVRSADLQAEQAWAETNGTWEDQNGQSNTSTTRNSQKDSAPVTRKPEEGAGDGTKTGPQEQRSGTGTPGEGQESSAGNSEGLTAPTRAEVLAQQAQREAEEQRKQDGGDRPLPGKKVTGDTPDMFNTQASVFDAPAEPVAKPASVEPTAKPEAAKITKESIVKKANDGDVFGRTAEILTGAAFKQLPNLTVGNVGDASPKNHNKNELSNKDKNKVSNLTSPYVLFSKKPNGDIIVLLSGSLEGINQGIDQKISNDAAMRAIVNQKPAVKPQSVDEQDSELDEYLDTKSEAQKWFSSGDVEYEGRDFSGEYAKVRGLEGGEYVKAVKPIIADLMAARKRHFAPMEKVNREHAEMLAKLPPPTEQESREHEFLRRGLYGLPDAQKKSFLKLAKVKSIDAFEGLAISDRREIVARWLDSQAETKPADQATAILDAANVTGKERIDALKDVKKGDITPDELKAAYPAKEGESKLPATDIRIGDTVRKNGVDYIVSGAINGAIKADRTVRQAGGITETETIFLKGDEAIQAKISAQPEAQAPKPAKIEDSGEVLEGARKLYAKNYAAKLAEGEGMDTAVVPLSKSWPEPDYQRLLDEGADPWAVAMARAMREEVPTKPSSWKLKGWVQKVEALRDMTAKVMSGEMTKERFKTTGGQFNLADWFNKIDLYEAVGHAKSLKTLKFSRGEYGMYDGQTFSPPKVMWSINMPGTDSSATWSRGNWGHDLVVADTKAEAIEKFKAWSEAQGEAAPAAAKATSFDIYSYRSKPGITIVGKRINSTKSIDLKEFSSVKEAREYKAVNQIELEALLAKAKFEPSERGESNAPRVGADHRNGSDVTSEQFREAFGFRGEQFGASMPQNERQANMNQAFDALMDLAGVVGIPPKALSLNGELGLAFGARGTGGKGAFAAHYERDTTGAVTPNRVVINLTRKNGAGSLAHEWFHAVDNYFARMQGQQSGMMTERITQDDRVRAEMKDAFKRLMSAIGSTAVRERSKQLDKKRVKDYWSTGIEMSARSFESYVIAKLQDNNGSNDYLANIVPESLYIMQGSYPYPVMGEIPVIRAAFDNFFNTVQTKATEQGVAMFEPITPYGGNQTETPAFKAWFGDSKVVDDAGKPLVMYHGTPADFHVFNPGLIFLSPDPAFGGEEAIPDDIKVLKLYVKAENPFDFENSDHVSQVAAKAAENSTADASRIAEAMTGPEGWMQIERPEVQAAIEALGFDGFYVEENGVKNLAVFNNTQVKSATGNNGNWDGTKPSIVESQSGAYTVDAPRKKYPNENQFELFLNSEPDASQAGPAVEASRRDAVAAVQDLHATGSILAQALSSDYAARQRTNLVGQTVGSSEDLAVLAQLYRDPRFETFRVIFTGLGGKVVSQIGLTSRLPGSTSAIVGNDIGSYLSDLSRTAIQRGASGYYLLHNHPSGNANVSEADRKLTMEFSIPKLKFKGHVVIDTNEYSVIEANGSAQKFKHEFGQLTPMTSSQWGGMTFAGPKDVMAVAKQMQVDDDAVTLIVTNHQYKVMSVATIPHSAITSNPDVNKLMLAKAALVGKGSQLFAVGRNRMLLGRLGGSVMDAIHISDTGTASSMAEIGVHRSGSPFPADRRTRLTADTSPEFGYLRPFTMQKAQGRKVAESSGSSTVGFSRSRLNIPSVPGGYAGDVVVNIINNKLTGTGNSVTLVATFSDLPKKVQDAVDDPSGLKGLAYGQGQVFVIQDAIHSAEELEAVIIHELYGHVGLRSLFGPGVYSRLNKLGLSLGEAKIAELVKKYKLDVNGYVDYANQFEANAKMTRRAGGTEEMRRGWLMEEALAHIAEQETGTLKQMALEVVGQLRAWLREHGFMSLSKMGMSDIANILKLSRQAALSGPGVLEMPMFSRGGVQNPAQSSLFTPPAWTMPEATKLDRVIYELQDGRVDLKRAQAAIEKTGQQIIEKWDARLAETLYPGRVAYRSKGFLDTEVKPLLEAMSRQNLGMDELADYLHARGSEERNKQIAKVNPAMPDGGAGTNTKGDLMTTQAARDYLAAVRPARKQVLDAMAKRVDAITAGTRNLLVTEGLEKQSTIDAWEGAYKNYVPMFRDEAETGAPHPQGSGFTVRGSASKRATGSTKGVTNILAHVLMQREAAITRAEKNRVALSLYGQALSHPNPEFWTTIKPGMKSAQIAAELVAMGVDPMTAQVGMEGVPTIRTVDPITGKVVDHPNPMYKSLPGAITLRIHGEDRVLMLNAKNERALRLAGSLKNLHGLTELDIAGSIVGKSTRWLASVNTQYNPAFGLTNLTRDVLGGVIHLGNTELRGKALRVLLDTPLAIVGIARELAHGGQSGKWQTLYRQFQADGGQTGFKENFRDPNERAKAIEHELKNLGRASWNPSRAAHAILDLLDGFNTTLENAVRLSAYSEALNKGVSRAKAARLGRELTVDFNRKGRMGAELGPLYAFFNASVQGTARSIQAIKGPTGAKIIAGGLGIGVTQALMLLMAGYDDDEIPEFVKTRALIIPMFDKEKTFVSIPYPLGLHILPNTGRVLAELSLNGGKDIGKRIGAAIGEIAGAFNPLSGGNIFTADGALKTIAPTVIDPLIEMGFNKNFTGTSIQREGYGAEKDNRPGVARTKESTMRSTTGQAYMGISKAINALTGGTDYEKGMASPTPELVRYISQTVGGGVLRELEKTINTSTAASRGEPVKPSGIPVIGRFYGEVDDAQVQKSRYFESSARIGKLQSTIKAMEKADDDKAADAFEDKHPESELIRDLKRTKSALSKLDKQAVETINNPKELAEIDADRLLEMRDFNNDVTDVGKRVNQPTLADKIKAMRSPEPDLVN